MNAERAALPHDAVEQQGCGLRDLVVLHEELLELVDEKQGSGHRFGAARFLVPGHILDSELAVEIAAPFQLVVQALQDTEAEFPIAFDGHDAGMRKAMRGVALELNAFLEVDEVK